MLVEIIFMRDKLILSFLFLTFSNIIFAPSFAFSKENEVNIKEIRESSEKEQVIDKVTFIAESSIEQKLQAYGTEFELVQIKDQSDAVLKNFINEKYKWENND